MTLRIFFISAEHQTHMSNLAELRDMVGSFIDRRDWRQFQSAKELAVNLAVESAELLELFQWKDSEATDRELSENADLLYHVKSELADVIFGCLAMADHLSLDLEAVFRAKLDELDRRYPPEKVRGRVVKSGEGPINFDDW